MVTMIYYDKITVCAFNDKSDNNKYMFFLMMTVYDDNLQVDFYCHDNINRTMWIVVIMAVSVFGNKICSLWSNTLDPRHVIVCLSHWKPELSHYGVTTEPEIESKVNTRSHFSTFYLDYYLSKVK